LSWLNTFEQKANLATLQVVPPDFLPSRMKHLFELIFCDLLTKVRKNCSFILPTSENQITANFLRIMKIMTH